MNSEEAKALTEQIVGLRNDLKPMIEFYTVLRAEQIQKQKMMEQHQKAMEDTKQAVGSLPKELLDEIGHEGIEVDPFRPWFKIIRKNGSTISVKHTADGFRIRLRAAPNEEDKGGKLLKEMTPNHNGLAGAIKAIAAEAP